jgi:hypothetical protein
MIAAKRLRIAMTITSSRRVNPALPDAKFRITVLLLFIAMVPPVLFLCL